MRLKRYDLNRTEIVRLFDRQIPIYLSARGDRGVLVDELSRFGLTESLDDGCRYDRIDEEAWDIGPISFEDGKYVAVDHRDKSKHIILLYTLQVCGGAQPSGHEITNEIFYVNGQDRISAYLLIDAWCQKHPGRWLSMSVSGRARRALPRPCIICDAWAELPIRNRPTLVFRQLFVTPCIFLGPHR